MSRQARRVRIVDPHVEGQHQAIRAEGIEPATHYVGGGHGDAADHRALDAGIQQLLHAVECPQATAHLQAHSLATREFQDGRTIRQGTVASPVEIDDMDSACTE